MEMKQVAKPNNSNKNLSTNMKKENKDASENYLTAKYLYYLRFGLGEILTNLINLDISE